jgi:selenocysteine lyase/cysteine desulfurase
VPNYQVNVRQRNCDILFFSAHKLLAFTGLGVAYVKKILQKKLTPTFVAG